MLTGQQKSLARRLKIVPRENMAAGLICRDCQPVIVKLTYCSDDRTKSLEFPERAIIFFAMVHFCVLAPGQHSYEKTSHWSRAVGDTVFYLAGPRIEHQTFYNDSDVLSHYADRAMSDRTAICQPIIRQPAISQSCILTIVF